MADLIHPQYELINGIYLTLESVADIYGLVGIGDVHGVNLSDARDAMRLAEGFSKRKRDLMAILAEAITGEKQQHTAVIQPFAYKRDIDYGRDNNVPAAEADASLAFHFTYYNHPTDGLVAVSYQQSSASEIPFLDLRYGLREMEETYKQIRKELEGAQDREKDTELTAAWKEKEPYLAERFGWAEPIPEGLSFEAWSQASKKNWAPAIAAAKEFGTIGYILPIGDVVDRREFFRVPKIEQASP